MRPDLFSYTVNQLGGGSVQEELSEELAEIVKLCGQTGKVGKLTLTLAIKPRGTAGQFELVATYKSAPPEYDREVTILFGTEAGGLQRNDPRQQSLDIGGVVDTDTGEVVGRGK